MQWSHSQARCAGIHLAPLSPARPEARVNGDLINNVCEGRSKEGLLRSPFACLEGHLTAWIIHKLCTPTARCFFAWRRLCGEQSVCGCTQRFEKTAEFVFTLKNHLICDRVSWSVFWVVAPLSYQKNKRVSRSALIPRLSCGAACPVRENFAIYLRWPEKNAEK